jgi:hypothetical protein
VWTATTGTISSTGLYVAPAIVTAATTVTVSATSLAQPAIQSTAIINLAPSSIAISPASASVTAGGTQTFTAQLPGPALGPVQWLVNGTAGGSYSDGGISSAGVYTAPQISPGKPVIIQAVSAASSSVAGTAQVTVSNPPGLALTGATYTNLLSSWTTTQLPWIESLSGLAWDAGSRTWNPVPGWTAPANGIGPQIFYLYTALDPATEMAIAKQDISLMEELASFHFALLAQRTTTIGTMLKAAPPDAYIFIAGAANTRTFVSNSLYTATRVEVSECQLCDARYLLSASRLLWAIAKLPASQRTPPLTTFVTQFSGFLAKEQLTRLLYGSIPWSHWDNPNIPQPLVSAWTFLAATGYEPPHPIKYQAAMTDAELWLLADSAEVVGADAAAPELAILDASSRTKLQQAVAAGTQLLAARSHHVVAPDGADTLSTLAGDYDDDPDLAYSAWTGSELPTVPQQQEGLMADASHSSILPAVFRPLYETEAATGQSFPALTDLVALANTYVHLAYDGNAAQPDFVNYINGWNGWFRVGYPDIPGVYPPHQYCDARQAPDNCLISGALEGWGQLAVYNPDLVALEQNIVNLAYDDSPANSAFKNQHYFDNGPFCVTGNTYPSLFLYLVGDSAELVP